MACLPIESLSIPAPILAPLRFGFRWAGYGKGGGKKGNDRLKGGRIDAVRLLLSNTIQPNSMSNTRSTQHHGTNVAKMRQLNWHFPGSTP